MGRIDTIAFGDRFFPVIRVDRFKMGERFASGVACTFRLESVKASEADADAEARRLAQESPQAVFVICAPVEAYAAGERPIERFFLKWPNPAREDAPTAPDEDEW